MLLVELEEGPRLIAQLRGTQESVVSIGSPVHAEWDETRKQPLPVWVIDGNLAADGFDQCT